MTHPMTNPPRALSDKEAADRAETMFALDQQIRTALSDGRRSMWDAARALAKFDLENGWTALGYDDLAEWLADPEIGMSRTTYYRMVRVYRELERRKVSQKQLPTLEVSKVEMVLGKVQRGEVKIEEALDDARELGKRDLRIKYLGAPEPAGPPVDDDGVIEGTATDASPDTMPPEGQQFMTSSTDHPAPISPPEPSDQLSDEAPWDVRAKAFLLELRDRCGDPAKKRLPVALIAELNQLLGDG